ncbi:MAG: ShlB/FhaC/HecB family hemolysin secretion/activation protein [Alphaproteobacteria bacterium]|nr:ShlB/FhaC/HecB family hemolysin secretion/activation protein [Alphaproteobacteria bacterium]
MRLVYSLRRSLFCLLISLWIGLVVCVPHGSAQDIPSASDPARIREQIAPAPETPRASIEIPAPSGPVGMPIPEGAEKYLFTPSHIEVSGVRYLDPEKITAITDPYANREMAVIDLYGLAQRITRLYQDAGYLLSRAIIPPQEIENNQVVRIDVIEGYIADVLTQGERYPAFPVRQMIDQLKDGSPLNIHVLERQLLLLDQLPGLSVRAVLLPLDAVQAQDVEAGGVALNLIFDEDPNQYMASVDNYGSKFVGPWQAGVQADIATHWPYLAETSLSFQTTAQTHELKFLSAEQSIPVSSGGLRLVGALDYSRSEPGFTLDPSDVFSRYRSVRLGVEYPFIISREKVLEGFTFLEAKNVESTLLSLPFYDDRLRVWRGGVRYQDTYGRGETKIDVTLSRGVDALGARPAGALNVSRAQGKPDFTTLDMNLRRRQSLSEEWEMRLGLSGQMASSPLLSSEEFGFGGISRGRGYDPSEITGDNGISGSLELVYTGFNVDTDYLTTASVQPFAFYDAGKVWNRDQGGRMLSAASAGVGARISLENRVFVTGAVAFPLTRSAGNPPYGNGSSPRFLLGLQVQF